MNLRIAIAGIGLALLFNAAAAQNVPTIRLSGGEFFNQCTNPRQGSEVGVVAMCEMYVAGIADGLRLEGKTCLGPRTTKENLLYVSLWWIRNHFQYSNAEASLQIRNGFENVYSCRARPPNINMAMDEFVRIAKFMEAVKLMVAMFGG